MIPCPLLSRKENDMEYIEVDKAIEALYRYIFPTKKTIEEDIRAIPTIDIVRCGECRYCKKKRGSFNGEPIIFYHCEEHNRDVESDDYCSWGERKA